MNDYIEYYDERTQKTIRKYISDDSLGWKFERRGKPELFVDPRSGQSFRAVPEEIQARLGLRKCAGTIGKTYFDDILGWNKSSIENHHDELPSADDWIIYSSYHDPKQKDWDGHQIDTHGAVDYKAMKLFVMFVETLDC